MQTTFAALRNEKKRNKRRSLTTETDPMAIFHLDVSTVKRSEGRSAVAAAAYRAGARLRDERTGQVFDYARRRGIGSTFIAAPVDAPDWANDRNLLWNAAEAAETRKNSTVAREWLVALPAELDAEAREQLVRDFATELALRFDVVVDAAIHAPGGEGDERNHHAHLMTSTRAIGPEGFGAKTRVLDAAKTGGAEITAMRAIWADLCNDALETSGRSERIDPRAKGIQAAEAAARAQEAEDEAEALEIVNGDARSLSDVRRGLRAAISHPSALFARKGAEKAVERRSEAQEHREKAERLSKPPEAHRGPQRTAMERKAEKWEAAERKRVEKEEQRAFRRWLEEEHRKQERMAQERLAQEQRKAEERAAKVRAFVADWIIQAETFPTPAQDWRGGSFRFSPEAMQAEAQQQIGIELQAEEVRRGMIRALRVWVERIAEALPDLKPARSIWTAFTGGHVEAAKALHAALQDEPELGKPLYPAVEEAERHKVKRQDQEAARQKAAPKKPPKPKGPGNNGPTM